MLYEDFIQRSLEEKKQKNSLLKTIDSYPIQIHKQ